VSTYAASGTGSSIAISGVSAIITSASFSAPQAITELLTSGSTLASAEESSYGTARYSAAATLARVECNPRSVYAGEETNCQLQLDAAQSAGVNSLQVASSSSAVKVPPMVTTRPGQSILSFRASTDPAAAQQAVTVEARLGDAAVQENISILPAGEPLLRVPQVALAKIGAPARLTIHAAHAGEMPVQLAAAGLPEGSSFTPETGLFEWTPSQAQQGSHEVTFTASTAASSATGRTTIEVGSGEPVLVQTETASCSPSAVARLRGKWLSQADSAVADHSGGSTALGGARVKVNEQYVPVLYASPTELNILCPEIAPGSALQIAVETEAGATQPLDATMQEATPTLLTLDESAQALIAVSGTGRLAMVRNFRVAAQPAQPDDSISIWATGLGAAAMAGNAQVLLRVGEAAVAVDSMQPLAGFAGVYQLEARVPSAPPLGDSVPVQVEILRGDGQTIRSNTATIAIEPVQP
jgi:uncharacterized protein (TIGR03437 family)